MRERIWSKSLVALIAAASLSAPQLALGQAVWTNTLANELYTAPGNWQGNAPPAGNGTDSISLPVLSGTMEIQANSNADVSGITLTGSGTSQYSINGTGGATLTIGSGGVSTSGPASSYTGFSLPVVLSASQTWSAPSGWIVDYSSISSGASDLLTIVGTTYLFGDASALAGGITLSSGAGLFIESNGLGTGLLTLNSGTYLESYYSSSGITIANPILVLNGATLGEVGYAGYRKPLTFSGTMTVPAGSTNFTIPGASSIVATGTLAGTSGSSLTINGSGALPVYDNGSQLVVMGTMSQVAALSLSNVGVILDPAGNPATAFSSIGSSGLSLGGGSYLGFDGTFVAPGAVAGFIGQFAATLGPVINGGLGFDTYAGGTANIFTDPINLSIFTSANFLGLGSSTFATLSSTALITPGGGIYMFGGGGGTLTVASPLADGGSPRSLEMTYAPSPVTVILQGGSTYTGGTNIQGGVLIFDSAAPLTGTINNNYGYVGYTEMATNIASAAQFLGLFDIHNADGIIGFDSTVPSSPRTVSGPVDLSIFAAGGSSPFIGSATDVTLSGTMTPATNTFQLTGVKGGNLTVSSILAGSGVSAVVGLTTPIESNGTTSAVTLSGINTYDGGTTLNSGTLFINNASALGTGQLSVPNTGFAPVAPALVPYGGDVTIANAIGVGTYGSYGNPGLVLGNALTTDMLTLTGTIGDLVTPGQIAIAGNVTIAQSNTYTGGTEIMGNGSAALYVTPAGTLGSGTVNVIQVGNGNTSASLIASGGNVTIGNPINLQSYLTLGAPGSDFKLTLTGVVSGYNGLDIESNVELDGMNTFGGDVTVNNAVLTIGSTDALGTGQLSLSNSSLAFGSAFTSPLITDLGGDSNSVIDFTADPNTTLTLNNPYQNFTSYYYGEILGDTTTQVVKTGVGIEFLSGTNTYAGGTTVAQGTLISGSSTALGTGSVTVASGATLTSDGPGVLTNALVLVPGGTLAGTGNFSPPGSVSIGGGSIVQAGDINTGSPVATLTFGTDLTFASGGIYSLNIENAGGAAGSGYSTVDVPGNFTLSATQGSPFTIALVSGDPVSGNPGLATFDATLPYSMTILTAGTINGFSSNAFSFDTSAFQNPLLGGNFSVVQSGNSILLDFTPVPEPSTWALLLGGAAMVGLGIRRRSRAARCPR
jgi:fibronectin-binding autotransporter adhesin